MQDFSIVLAAISPYYFGDRLDAVFAWAWGALNRVDSWPIRSVLNNERGVGSNLVHICAGNTCIGAAVLILEISDLKRVLIVGILDESTWIEKRNNNSY